MTAEGYTTLAVLDSIVRGESAAKLLERAYRTYWTYQPPHTGKGTHHLINQSSKGFYRYSEPYRGDFDKDGLTNRIDPNPLKKNSYVLTSLSSVEISGLNGEKFNVPLTHYFDYNLIVPRP